MQSTDLTTVDSRNLMSPTDLRTQVNSIQHAMAAVMQEGTHYGKIPGTDKNTLFKAGSEVLLTMFHIAVDPQVEDLSDGDHVRYRVRCIGIHQPTGTVVGIGIGEASTAEEKYAWRRAVCEAEYDATDPSRRRIKYSAWQGKVSTTPQVRMNPADLANTVLKMAKKRAQIDMTLTATAASDIFSQDVEDLPAEIVEQVIDRPAARTAIKHPTQKESAPVKAKESENPDAEPASAGQVAYLLRQCGKDGAPLEPEVLTQFKLESLKGITLGQWKAIKAWLANPAPTAAKPADDVPQ